MPAIDWMQRGPFGVMVHFLPGIMPLRGEPDGDWNRVVDRFPVDAFCDAIAATGARWLIFPFGQNSGDYCSPNAYLESLLPGHCARRDLMRELGEGLRGRGVRLVAYLPAEVDFQAEPVRAAFGWDLPPGDRRVFQERYMAFIRCWSESLGPLLSGWWFDGCYDARRMSFCRTRDWDNTRFDPVAWGAAVRAGNPASVFAMNPGAGTFRPVLPGQDYLAGEADDLSALPSGPLVDGAQWHSLVWIDCRWAHLERPGPIAPPRFTTDTLHAYVAAVRARGGAATLNIGISQEGVMGEASLAQLREIARRIRG